LNSDPQIQNIKDFFKKLITSRSFKTYLKFDYNPYPNEPSDSQDTIPKFAAHLGKVFNDYGKKGEKKDFGAFV